MSDAVDPDRPEKGPLTAWISRFSPARFLRPGRIDPRAQGRRLLAVPRRAWRPLGGLLGPAIGDASQSLGALALAAATSLITGFTFAFFADTLRANPGLLLFIPAAFGLRGNVFGPLGSRLSTAMAAGTMNWSWRRDSLLGQNVIGAMASSLVAALGLAVIAEVVVLLIAGDEISAITVADFVCLLYTSPSPRDS